jgi:hypothetical protein
LRSGTARLESEESDSANAVLDYPAFAEAGRPIYTDSYYRSVLTSTLHELSLRYGPSKLALATIRRVKELTVQELALSASDQVFRVKGREIRYLPVPVALLRGDSRIPLRFRVANVIWKATTERRAEVPIALAFVSSLHGSPILEVGNVLSYYSAIPNHWVVDRYETGPGVRNLDVLMIPREELYDGIVSISTLEHVGYDERPRDPGKFERAIEALEGHLSPSGRMLITVPLSYNPAVDRWIHRADRLGFDVSIVGRDLSDSRRGSWKEYGPSEALPDVEAIAVLRR